MSECSHFNVSCGFGSNTIPRKLKGVKNDVTNTEELNGPGMMLLNADCDTAQKLGAFISRCCTSEKCCLQLEGVTKCGYGSYYALMICLF